MINPKLSKTVIGVLLSWLVGCGYSPLDTEPAAEELAGIYLPGHSVVINAKQAYSAEDLLRLHITLSADQTIEAVLPDAWRAPMGSDENGRVEHYSGTWSIAKDSKESPALSLQLKNSDTGKPQEFSLSLAEHGDQPIIGLNVITNKTKWFGFSSTHIQKDIWFRKKNDKLDAYLEKNLQPEPEEQPEA